jgi:hypothetical protein
MDHGLLPDYSQPPFWQVFNSVEIKPEMTGHYLGEFSCSYRPVKHGRPGVSSSSLFLSASFHKSFSSDRCHPLYALRLISSFLSCD